MRAVRCRNRRKPAGRRNRRRSVRKESFPAPLSRVCRRILGNRGGTAELPAEPTQEFCGPRCAGERLPSPRAPRSRGCSRFCFAASLSEIVGGKSVSATVPQAKSVRISLEQLDRMMNAVGELVINRTRMLGRLKELSKLVEVLAFSKSGSPGKWQSSRKSTNSTVSARTWLRAAWPRRWIRSACRCAGYPAASRTGLRRRFQRTRNGPLRRLQYSFEVAHRNFRGRQRSAGAVRMIPLAGGCGHR